MVPMTIAIDLGTTFLTLLATASQTQWLVTQQFLPRPLPLLTLQVFV
jgi:hypothetical protein